MSNDRTPRDATAGYPLTSSLRVELYLHGFESIRVYFPAGKPFDKNIKAFLLRRFNGSLPGLSRPEGEECDQNDKS